MPSEAIRALSERQKRKFEEIDSRLKSRLKERDRNDWEIGNDLRLLSRDHLWRVAGYASFNTYVDGEFGMSPTQARALRRAARFPREAVERYGWGKLDLVARLWEQLPGD